MTLYDPKLVLLLACAALFYTAGEMEKSSGVVWAGLSVVVFVVTWIVLGWSWLGCIGGQVAVVAALTAMKGLRKR